MCISRSEKPLWKMYGENFNLPQGHREYSLYYPFGLQLKTNIKSFKKNINQLHVKLKYLNVCLVTFLNHKTFTLTPRG